MSWNREEIVDLLLEAGDVARRAKRNLSQELKSDRSIVTQADREIEELLTRRLEDPSQGKFIIGEETIAQKGEDYVARALREESFVVDPIDGTAPFAYGLPNWGISIGRMEGGALTDGAIYLPEYGEMLLSRELEGGRAVEEGRFEEGRWSWRTLPPPVRPPDGLVAVTQALAKRGKCRLHNTVIALGAAVVPLAGILQGRFLAYLGSVKLWDAAGALPLILQQGLSVQLRAPEGARPVTARVDDTHYVLSPSDRRRWYFRGSLLICHSGDEARMEEALVEDDCDEGA